MLKKLQIAFSLLLVLVFLASCSSLPNPNQEVNDTSVLTEQSETKLSFSEALDISNCVAVGEFISYKDKDDFVEYEFKVVDVLLGDVEDTVHLFSMKGTSEVEGAAYSYGTGKDIYQAGERYVLIMEKNDLIFYDYPHYVLVTDIYIPLESIDNSTMYGEPIADIAKNSSIDDIVKLISKAQKLVKDENYANYTTAEDTPTIAKESEFILEIKVTDIMSEGVLHNGDTYYCDVLKILKGESLVRLEKRDDILITLMKGSVKVGETYIVMVNRISGESAIYTQSSKNSIILPNDTEALKAIESTL